MIYQLFGAIVCEKLINSKPFRFGSHDKRSRDVYYKFLKCKTKFDRNVNCKQTEKYQTKIEKQRIERVCERKFSAVKMSCIVSLIFNEITIFIGNNGRWKNVFHHNTLFPLYKCIFAPYVCYDFD